MLACSTTPATRYLYVKPSDALLVRPTPPHLVKSERGRDLVANSNSRQHAYEQCVIRFENLASWHEEMQRREDTVTVGEKSPKPSLP